jgi:hypothetical protein
MKRSCNFGESRRERGAAMLIAIFSLLLISVVAIALIVSSGTDSALASNYRTSASAYYAALAGLEEARGRLLPNNPNCIPLPPNTVCNPQPFLTMPLTQVVYIINSLNGEVVAPENPGNPSTYSDNEYFQEFGVNVGSRVITRIASTSPVAGMPGPMYKWVRINAVTEQALGDPQVPGSGVDVDGDGSIDPFTLLFYNPANPNVPGTPTSPGLVGMPQTPPSSNTSSQAFEITSYAVLPNGSQKMLQYVVRPLLPFANLNAQTFNAALTLAGNNVQFTGPGPSAASFIISGQDPCPGAPAMLPAIGYTNGASSDTSSSNISHGATPAGNYVGSPIISSPPPPPAAASGSIVNVSSAMNPNWLTPAGLDAVVHDITSGADAVITGPTTPNSFPAGMSATNPMTIVVNGDLDMTGWRNTGYGLLVVTGTLNYDPDASWQGVVLVIGKGRFVSTKNGTGEIDGAVLIAETRDSANNLLPTLGPAYFSQTGSGSNQGLGIRYNSCLVSSALGPITYKLVSFREIPF